MKKKTLSIYYRMSSVFIIIVAIMRLLKIIPSSFIWWTVLITSSVDLIIYITRKKTRFNYKNKV